MTKFLKTHVVTVSLVAVLVLAMGALASAAKIGPEAFKPVVGNWAVENGAYVNSDNTNNNTQADAEVDQSGKVLTWTFTIEFRDTTFSLGPAAGMHILADSVDDPARGNSYLVFQDSDFIRLYRAGGGRLTKVMDFPVTAKVGDKFSYKVVFNTESGEMKIYRNDQLVGEWTDALPLKSGKYVSLRSNGTAAAFSDISFEAE